MKNIFVFYSLSLLSIIILLGCQNKNRSKQSITAIDSAIEKKHKWLKEYALCSCIKYSFKNDSAISNHLSFTIYKEITDYDKPAIYKLIYRLSKKASNNIKPSQIADFNGKRAILSGCINFAESKTLDSLIKTFDKIENNR